MSTSAVEFQPHMIGKLVRVKLLHRASYSEFAESVGVLSGYGSMDTKVGWSFKHGVEPGIADLSQYYIEVEVLS